jgi:hypothetical protein
MNLGVIHRQRLQRFAVAMLQEAGFVEQPTLTGF